MTPNVLFGYTTDNETVLCYNETVTCYSHTVTSISLVEHSNGTVAKYYYDRSTNIILP